MAVISTHRSRIAAASVALLLPALAGCATSFGAVTDEVYTPAQGVNNRDAQVDVLNVVVVSGSDGSGTVSATLVNNDDDKTDQLLEVHVDGNLATLQQGGKTNIPPNGSLEIGSRGLATVTGDNIQAGRFVEVDFVFANAGTVTVKAPVVPHADVWSSVPVKPAG